MNFDNFYNIQQNINDSIKNLLVGVPNTEPLQNWADAKVIRFLSKLPESDVDAYIRDNKPTPEFEHKIQHVFDYLKNLQPNELQKQLRGNFEQVLANADKWSTLNQKRGAKLANEPEDALDLIYDFGNGYKLVGLTTNNQLKREGNIMGHCVGGYTIERLNKNNAHIYSLRDPKNNPHVTLEYISRRTIFNSQTGINQIKGKGDRAPIEKYQLMIREWLATRPDIKIISDKENIGYASIDGSADYDLFDANDAKEFYQHRQEYIIARAGYEKISEGTFKNIILNNLHLTKLPEIFNNSNIIKNFDCRFNKLTTLENSPRDVGWAFDCSFNNLTSLKGGPDKVASFECNYNDLTTLEGGPSTVNGGYFVGANSLTSLKGAPKFIKGNFDCSLNPLKTLEGIPKIIEGSFTCRTKGPNPFTEEYVRSLSDIQGYVTLGQV